MSEGFLLQIFNKTDHDVKLGVRLTDDVQWESATKKNPKSLDGTLLEANASTSKSWCEAAGSGSAKFRITFEIQMPLKSGTSGGHATIGKSVSASVDAEGVINGKSRKRSLDVEGLDSEFLVLVAEYDKEDNDQRRNLAVALVPKRDPKTWMSKLKNRDKLGIKDITLPGTHDSGTAADIYVLSQTQTLSIREQLAAGVRFVDMRLNKDNTYEICHGASNTGLYFEADCVDHIAEFLCNHGPDETVLMCVKSEKGTTDGFHDGVLGILESSFRKYFGNDWEQHVFTGKDPDDTLEALKGKVVLLRRYWIDLATNDDIVARKKPGVGLSSNPGTDPDISIWYSTPQDSANHLAWPDNSDTFDQTGDQYVVQYPAQFHVAIQDWYDLQTSYYGSKIKLVQKYLQYATKSNYSSVWFLNFLSCGTSAREGNPVDFAKGDTELNASLFKYLILNPRTRYGTLILDFPEFPENLLQLIINSNAF